MYNIRHWIHDKASDVYKSLIIDEYHMAANNIINDRDIQTTKMDSIHYVKHISKMDATLNTRNMR